MRSVCPVIFLNPLICGRANLWLVAGQDKQGMEERGSPSPYWPPKPVPLFSAALSVIEGGEHGPCTAS